jgi:hypothetical protein
LLHQGTEDTVKKRKLRIISKIGLLFVIIGFFMPISCNLNGFQIALSPKFITIPSGFTAIGNSGNAKVPDTNYDIKEGETK